MLAYKLDFRKILGGIDGKHCLLLFGRLKSFKAWLSAELAFFIDSAPLNIFIWLQEIHTKGQKISEIFTVKKKRFKKIA